LPGKGAYLWAGAIPTGQYTTYLTSTGQGGTLNAGLMTAGLVNATQTLADLPMAHTVLCLSCHDTTFNANMAAAIPGSTTKTLNFNVGNNGNLAGDHPVDVKYPTADPMYFGITIDGPNKRVSFTDTSYPYGHPARLYTDGTFAYVECSTCHNPHAQTAAVVSVGATKYAVGTTHFIRGQYRSTNEVATGAAPIQGAAGTTTTYRVDNANFCMSCHAYPSSGFTGSVH
jgi:nitrate reductase cytochrome c-type subunit